MSARARQRLVLWAPPDEVPEDILLAAIAAGDVAAVVLSGVAAGHPSGGGCQAAGPAAFLTVPPMGAADGLHAAGDLEARAALVRGAGDTVVGAEAASKHEAMLLGEAGAQYLWFGAPGAADAGALELARWWSELFEVPAVAAGAPRLADVEALVATGAEFIALGPPLLAAGSAAHAVAHAQALIEAA